MSKTALETKETSLPERISDNPLYSYIQVIERIANNPEVDVDKLKQMMDMQEHLLDRQAEKEFNQAMVRAQSEMPIVPEDDRNQQTNSTYSKYETILKYTKPIYTAEGFSVMFYEGEAKNESEVRVMADIMHSGGHTKQRYTDVPFDNVGIKGNVNKTNTHAKGSSLSYGKGYLLKMIFNIPTGDDDDGNAAGKIVEVITDDEARLLHARITDNDLPMDKFLKKVQSTIKVQTIEEIPIDWLTHVNKWIDASIKAKENA